MKIKSKYVLIISAVLLFVLGGFIWYVDYLSDIIQDHENTIAVQVQNKAALQDQLDMQADSLQDYAIFVKNLTTDNEDAENKYILLKNRYYILLDSIKVLNEDAEVDTSGDTIIVSFEGREGKVMYKGHTTYFKLTAKGTYTIEIGVDPMKVESEVYLDKENDLIRNKIYIDGALIDGATTEIDSALYILIRNNELERPDELGFFDRLHLLTETGLQLKQENGIFTPDKYTIQIGTEYQFYRFRIFGKFDVINQDINVGVQYHPSVSDIWKAIF